MEKKILRLLRQLKINSKSRLLVAYSGGPDSTCLLFILNKCRSVIKFSLACAYVDHGLRCLTEREEELQLVQQTTESLGLPLFIKRIPEGALWAKAQLQKQSLEALAREERYQFFTDLKNKEGFDYLCLGHNLEDQVETILMRLFSGSGPEALAGMQIVSNWFLRPLLRTSRKEIETYLKKNSLAFFSDSTNQKTDFLRNKLRHQLLPLLQKIFPGLGRSFLALSKKAGWLASFLEIECAKRLVWNKTEKGYNIDLFTFLSAHPALRLKSIYQIVSLLKRDTQKRRLPFRSLLSLIEASKPEDLKLPLKVAGIIIKRQGESLFLEKDIVLPNKKDYFIISTIDKPFVFKEKKYNLGDIQKISCFESVLCEFKIEPENLPLTIRNWQAGDRIVFSYGRKKLKKLFSDWKVPQFLRNKFLVLEDKQGIIAVVGKHLGYKNAIRWQAEIKYGLAAGERAVAFQENLG